MAAPLVVAEDVDISNEEEIDEQASYSLATLPAKCEASGAGLAEAIVRQETFFDIKACDGRGQPKEHGGDAFFVSIRGCGVRVRARVIDHRDGSYTVRYKPEISGSYAVAISLYGDSLPGSPFLLRASTPTAVASECVLRGEALHLAIARTQQHFEVSFRDATGQVAHAEELDVYVELAEEEPNNQDALNSAPRESEHRETENKREPRDSKTLRSSRAAHVAAAAAADAEKGQSATAASSLGTMTAHERNFWLKRIPPLPTKQTKPRSADRDIARECVVTSKSPLIVRSDLALNSERLCQLLPEILGLGGCRHSGASDFQLPLLQRLALGHERFVLLSHGRGLLLGRRQLRAELFGLRSLHLLVVSADELGAELLQLLPALVELRLEVLHRSAGVRELGLEFENALRALL